MRIKLGFAIALTGLGAISPVAYGQTTGTVPLVVPHYGTSEGTGVVPAPRSSVPFNSNATVPAPQALPSVGSPLYGPGPIIVPRRH